MDSHINRPPTIVPGHDLVRFYAFAHASDLMDPDKTEEASSRVDMADIQFTEHFGNEEFHRQREQGMAMGELAVFNTMHS